MYQSGIIAAVAQKHLRRQEQEALNAAVKARDREIAAEDRASAALRDAVEAGVPVLQLVRATGIPRMTLLRRIGKVPTQATATDQPFGARDGGICKPATGATTHGGNP